jgi:hypothetical protein
MLNVHGIRVAGGTFPAQIWGDYMGRALQARPLGWVEPKRRWEWRPWRGAHSLSSRLEDPRPDGADPYPPGPG